MNELLARAIAQIEKLPDDQQRAIAALILDELAGEAEWAESFADPASPDLLKSLAEQARECERQGRAHVLDPKDMS